MGPEQDDEDDDIFERNDKNGKWFSHLIFKHTFFSLLTSNVSKYKFKPANELHEEKYLWQI